MSFVGFGPPGFDDRDTDLFLCDTNTCKFDGECLRIGNMVTCICDFKVRPVTFLLLLIYFYVSFMLATSLTNSCPGSPVGVAEHTQLCNFFPLFSTRRNVTAE